MVASGSQSSRSAVSPGLVRWWARGVAHPAAAMRALPGSAWPQAGLVGGGSPLHGPVSGADSPAGPARPPPGVGPIHREDGGPECVERDAGRVRARSRRRRRSGPGAVEPGPVEPGVRHDEQKLTGIPGRPPALANPPAGCRFADRCPFATPQCAKQPDFAEVRPGHHVACWKVAEVGAVSTLQIDKVSKTFRTAGFDHSVTPALRQVSFDIDPPPLRECEPGHHVAVSE